MSFLTQIVKDEFVRYFRHMASRVERAARALPREKLWVKPFTYGNSVGHLVLHLTGNLNHYIGARIAGTGYVRNRPIEFTEANPPSAEDALARFQDAVNTVVTTIQQMDENSYGTAIDPKDGHPIGTRFGMLLVCASHMNNHIGQMAYLVQAHGHSTEEPPVW